MPIPTPIVAPTSSTLIRGHCLDVLRTLPRHSVDCAVTSPPYWGLRNYNTEPQVWDGDPSCAHRWVGDTCTRCGAWQGSLGLEPTPALYAAHLVLIFREVGRVLKPSGTLWLVLGDSYAGSWGSYGTEHARERSNNSSFARPAYQDNPFLPPTAKVATLKRKDLVGIPWQIAFALRGDGWYLRSDIVWHKPNATPESVKDRPTRAHEFIFLLAKNPRYYYDRAAIAEPASPARRPRPVADRQRSERSIVNIKGRALPPRGAGPAYVSEKDGGLTYLRNRRSVWTLPTRAYRGAHFATFPPELIRPCVRAGCPVGGIVLDPFMGTGTSGLVAHQEGRNFVGIELNADYLALARERLGVSGTFSAS